MAAAPSAFLGLQGRTPNPQVVLWRSGSSSRPLYHPKASAPRRLGVDLESSIFKPESPKCSSLKANTPTPRTKAGNVKLCRQFPNECSDNIGWAGICRATGSLDSLFLATDVRQCNIGLGMLREELGVLLVTVLNPQNIPSLYFNYILRRIPLTLNPTQASTSLAAGTASALSTISTCSMWHLVPGRRPFL